MITIISGTTRTASRTKIVTDIYAEVLESKGITNQVLDLSEMPDLIHENGTYARKGYSDEFEKVRQVMIDSSKMVFVVPEYNGSFPGMLKAFIDAMPYPATWKDKKVGLIGLGNGVQGAVLALSHLTDIFHYMNAEVMGFKPKLNFIHTHLANGKLTNELFMQMLNEHADRMERF